MTAKVEAVEALLKAPDLASAIESEQFKHFLDQIPIAIIVSEMARDEHIIYANPEFERMSGQACADIEGKPWSVIRGKDIAGPEQLGAAITESSDCIGTFQIDRADGESSTVDVYSNVIESHNGVGVYRLAAFVDVSKHGAAEREDFKNQLREKDTQLREIQHRVKNNLQMITALIRVEARNAQGRIDTASFDRLAGRINSIKLLHTLLDGTEQREEVDLGVYLSDIASSVMHAHAVEGIRLDLKVDSYPVSLNVAMPTGLVVNELLTNSIKHAFVGREGGTITLHSLADETGCKVVIADNGNGLPQGTVWPKPGKLGMLIVRSLRENAKAKFTVESNPETGTRVTIVFTRAAAAVDSPSAQSN